MTSRSDVERVLDRYLADGAEQVPDRVIDAALDQIESTHQRRAVRVPWRFPEMPSVFKLAVGGAAVIAVLLVGGMFLTRGPTNGAGGPPVASVSPSAAAAASPTASASPSPSAVASLALTDTSNWESFASDRYGYEMAHPPAWAAEPARRDWSLETDRTDWLGNGVADRFRGPGVAREDTLVTAFADQVPPGMSEDEWVAAYFIDAPEECGPTDSVRPISVDGHPGRLVNTDACDDASQAFVFLDGRVHVFAIWRANQEELLVAFLSTVEFQQ